MPKCQNQVTKKVSDYQYTGEDDINHSGQESGWIEESADWVLMAMSWKHALIGAIVLGIIFGIIFPARHSRETAKKPKNQRSS